MHNESAVRKPQRSYANGLALVCLAFIAILYVLSDYGPGAIIADPRLQIFKTVFVSIILETMPFLWIGVFLSAILHVYVPDRLIQRMIPRNPILGIIAASVLGIVFPLCECGIVPAIRRLINKGMPVYAASTFILVGPILNPLVFWSTFTAFRGRPEIAYGRMGLAFIVALIVGLIVYRFVRSNPLRVRENRDHEHDHSHENNKLAAVMGHAINEFFDMGKYIVFGAMIVGLLQTFVSQTDLASLGQASGSANALMMGLGFILSLCSTSDAFVAQSFVTSFSGGALIAFMVFGPMINLKGVLMMSAVFKTKFVALLVSLVVILVYAGTFVLDYVFLK
ncbi:permease [Cohnella terricola]|uniref:Permease n=1 Tax=Cohnella terricola TaxID=1289167 RepID=A0A559J9E7_9BACL|nr:permease [Cohnella terricola]TVX96510.1 permease [Cohnella terricola]